MTDDTPAPANVVNLNTAQKAGKKGEKCPVCAKPSDKAYQPFCSKRCADIDLGKWLDEGYRIPTNDVPGMDDTFDGED